MVGLKKEIINSVADLADFVSRKSIVVRYLFRGQNVDKPLLPSIARQKRFTGESLVDIEKGMLNRLQIEAAPFLRMHPKNDLDWLSIAQHQGMSTRLLDWTASALTALWFAVASDPPDGEDHGVLWVLKFDEDDILSLDDSNNIFKLNKTYIFQPVHIDKRITAQAAWFSIHKYMNKGEGKFIPLNGNSAFKSKLVKFYIPRASFRSIRRELRIMGVTKASLFPDLTGLSLDINAQFLEDECLDPETDI